MVTSGKHTSGGHSSKQIRVLLTTAVGRPVAKAKRKIADTAYLLCRLLLSAYSVSSNKKNGFMLLFAPCLHPV